MSSTTATASSPFQSRTYGGYTAGQIAFYTRHLGRVEQGVVLDPMAGQAYALSSLALAGATLHLGDLNPAPLLLATLRDPRLFENAAELIAYVRSVLRRMPRRTRPIVLSTYCDDWVPRSIAEELMEYANLVGLGLFASPFAFDGGFWNSPAQVRFAAAIAILAAREITTFQATDNAAWLRPGGYLRATRIAPALKSALGWWSSYAKSHAGHQGDGRIVCHRMDAEAGEFGGAPKTRAIVTSPPYGNRLDYTRLWGPEGEVLTHMVPGSLESVRMRQVGSPVVRTRGQADGPPLDLPELAVRALTQIREDGAHASENHYYPFFRNYARSLTLSLRNMAQRLLDNGTLVIFVRDTVRKDTLFPTGEIVSYALHSAGMDLIDTEQRMIGNHIGNRRRVRTGSCHGPAQREWWFAFRKRGE